MNLIESGNFNKDMINHPERKGWSLGRFIEQESLRNTQDLEIKWMNHPKGEKYNISKANITSRSLGVLISGKIKFFFPDEKQEVILENQGDYVIWDRNVYHHVEFLEDTTFLTVRWPSVENDVVTKVI